MSNSPARPLLSAVEAQHDPLERRSALGTRFEEIMGDPWGSSLFSFPSAIQRYENEVDPTEAFNELVATGFMDWFVPQIAGGQGANVDETYVLSRLIARRDQTLATAASASTVGFMPIWVGGSDEQRARFGAEALSGMRFGLGLSEGAHGSDVLGNETTATLHEGNWEVTGSKQAIGNANRAERFTVAAFTDERRGPASMSLLVVDRLAAEEADTFELDHVWRAQGLRGFGLGDFTLNGARTPEENVIGKVGRGLETTMQSSQVIRTVITSLAFGNTDASLRTALDFTGWREIYGRKLRETPYTQSQLAEAFARLMFLDGANLAAIRALQTHPRLAAVLSSAVKYAVPRGLDHVADLTTQVLGARHYDRENPRVATHVKGMLGARVAHFADGNEVVNLRALAPLAGQLLPDGDLREVAVDDTAQDLVEVADLTFELPAFRPHEQQVISRPTRAFANVYARAAKYLQESGDEHAPAVLSDLERIWENFRAAGDVARAGGSDEITSTRAAESLARFVVTACGLATWLAHPDPAKQHSPGRAADCAGRRGRHASCRGPRGLPRRLRRGGGVPRQPPVVLLHPCHPRRRR